MSNFWEQNQGNEKSNNSSSSSSSSRRGKKSSSNSNKIKQPQRGLGVAQLEKIRLQTQYGPSNYLPTPHAPFYPNLTQENMRMQEAYSSTPTSSPFSYNFPGHPNIMMGMGEVLERGNVRYGDSQPIAAPNWIPGNGMLETPQFAQPSMTRHFMNQQVEDAQKRINDPVGGSIGQNSETSDTEELDLELRL